MSDSFKLSENSLSSAIPTELGRLVAMTSTFKLYSNRFCSDVPTEVTALSRNVTDWAVTTGNSDLGSACSYVDDLARFPEIGDKGTTNIDYSHRDLAGTIPTEFGLLTDVTSFSLTNISLTGSIPTELGDLVLLQTMFFLSSNYLSAWIPTELGNFKSMKANFALDNNAGICDYIPTQVAALSGSISGWDITTGNSLGTPCCELLSDFNCLPITNLSTAATTDLDFSTSQYTGTIPTEAGRLTALTSLSLESNTLTGPVPSELGNLVAMKVEFQLYSNRLSSSLPTQLGRMTALTTLFELYENSLSASLPSELGALTSLASWLRLDLNSITAEVPTELGSLTQLTAALFLESNQLCGWDAIPTEVAALTASVTSNWEVSDGNDGIGTPCCETLSGYNCLPVGLPTSATTYIDLNERNHTGTIPTEFGLLTLTTELSVEKNSLTGSIPSEIGMLSGLDIRLHLDYNMLDGRVPTELGQLTALAHSLKLRENSFTGTIGTELGNMDAITKTFELEKNLLTGAVPSELGKLVELATGFSLRSNSLSSTIPTELGQLESLRTFFYLSSNEFCSDVPTEVSALSRNISNWLVESGNDLGTVCFGPTPLPTVPAPSPLPTLTPTVTCEAGEYAFTSEKTKGLTACELCPSGFYNICSASGKFSSDDRSSCGGEFGLWGFGCYFVVFYSSFVMPRSSHILLSLTSIVPIQIALLELTCTMTSRANLVIPGHMPPKHSPARAGIAPPAITRVLPAALPRARRAMPGSTPSIGPSTARHVEQAP
mmetsp:Transcript_87406/g.248124  ORF Transcript_87406/g.248124 Transcript_87406/m.248124 type:complete len:775 (-) Transcript_87406:3925-6249(-)